MLDAPVDRGECRAADHGRITGAKQRKRISLKTTFHGLSRHSADRDQRRGQVSLRSARLARSPTSSNPRMHGPHIANKAGDDWRRNPVPDLVLRLNVVTSNPRFRPEILTCNEALKVRSGVERSCEGNPGSLEFRIQRLDIDLRREVRG